MNYISPISLAFCICKIAITPIHLAACCCCFPSVVCCCRNCISFYSFMISIYTHSLSLSLAVFIRSFCCRSIDCFSYFPFNCHWQFMTYFFLLFSTQGQSQFRCILNHSFSMPSTNGWKWINLRLRLRQTACAAAMLRRHNACFPSFCHYVYFL